MKEHKTVLITGATQGLGYEFAKLFAKDNYDLVLVARDEARLKEVAKELQSDDRFIKIIPADLLDPATPQKIYDQLQQDEITIEVLVNNAGMGNYGKFYTIDTQKILAEVDLNMRVVTHLTSLFIKDMVARDEGKILNIASGAAFQPGPLMAVYYASKAYILHFSEALAEELHGTGVTVTVLCPGTTRTQFQKTAQMENSKLMRHTMSAKEVTKAGYEGLMQGKRIVVPGWRNKFNAQGYRFLPRALAAKIAMRMQEREN